MVDLFDFSIPAVSHIVSDRSAEGRVDGADFRSNLVEIQVEIVGVDEIEGLCLLGIPKTGNQHLHQTDHPAGLLETLVFLELGHQFTEVRMKRVRIADPTVECLWGSGGEVHLVGLTESLPVGGCDGLDLDFRRDLGKEAFSKDVIELVPVWIDGGDGHRDAAGLGSNALHRPVKRSLKATLTDAKVGPS